MRGLQATVHLLHAASLNLEEDRRAESSASLPLPTSSGDRTSSTTSSVDLYKVHVMHRSEPPTRQFQTFSSAPIILDATLPADPADFIYTLVRSKQHSRQYSTGQIF